MSSFRYWNENPQGEKRNDCVTRAIVLASDLPYNIVRNLLILGPWPSLLLTTKKDTLIGCLFS